MGLWKGLSLQKGQPICVTCSAGSQGHLTPAQMAACSLPLGLGLLLLLQDIQTSPQVRQGDTRILPGEGWGTWGCRATLPFSWVLGWVPTEAGLVQHPGLKVVSRALRR